MSLTHADERTLLASMLTIPDSIPLILAVGVRATSYSTDQHAKLHEAIIDCYIDLRRPIDAVDVGRRLIDEDELDLIGGAEGLASILEHFPTQKQFENILDRYVR